MKKFLKNILIISLIAVIGSSSIFGRTYTEEEFSEVKTALINTNNTLKEQLETIKNQEATIVSLTDKNTDLSNQLTDSNEQLKEALEDVKDAEETLNESETNLTKSNKLLSDYSSNNNMFGVYGSFNDGFGLGINYGKKVLWNLYTNIGITYQKDEKLTASLGINYIF